MPRAQLKEKVEPATAVNFISSGSTLLDLVLGGGWAEGRIANIVGDKSAGKTLLAIEACANFAVKYSAERIAYRESEAAFDMPYAQTMGMPKGVSWSEDIRTVEDLDKDIAKWLDRVHSYQSNMYILDSLDALSDDAEADREIGTASYGTGKAKAMSEMLRRRAAGLRDKRCTMLVISQIRDKIGVMFGETKTRSGGRALDFYSSQIVWLSEIKKIKRVITGVERIVGVEVLARNKKNKCGLPFRQAEFSILFGYGVDDEKSMIDWLKKNKGEKHLEMPLSEVEAAYSEARRNKDRTYAREVHNTLKEAVRKRWFEIEEALEPAMNKYGD